MITITDAAKEALYGILRKAKESREVGLRLTISREGELEMIPDIEQPGDIVYEYEGKKVAFVASSIAEMLDGIVLDAKKTLRDPQLVIITDGDDCCDECGGGCCSHGSTGDGCGDSCCDDTDCC